MIGAERLFRFAPFTAFVRFRSPGTLVRLSFVVELSCRVRTFAPLKNKKNLPCGRLLFLAGAERLFRFASFTAFVRFRSPAHTRVPLICSRTLLPSSNICPTQKQKKPPLWEAFVFGRGSKNRCHNFSNLLFILCIFSKNKGFYCVLCYRIESTISQYFQGVKPIFMLRENMAIFKGFERFLKMAFKPLFSRLLIGFQ